MRGNSVYYVLISLICLSLNTHVNAQNTINPINIDQKSYQLYTDKKWDSLIVFGNKAIKEGTDYYYLRMRIGIAYFEKQHYIAAKIHFEKALMFNTGDDLAMEYLYYCHIYSSHFEEARKLSQSFNDSLAKKNRNVPCFKNGLCYFRRRC